VFVFVFVFVFEPGTNRAHQCRMPAPAGGFEDLRVWQFSRELCRDVHPVSQACARAHDYPLSQQLNRASLSVMANIAEGYLRRTQREFASFIRIAAGSNAEVRALLYAAADRQHVGLSVVQPLLARSNDIGRMLQGLLDAVHERGETARAPRR
jgi:four helix bundle protein